MEINPDMITGFMMMNKISTGHTALDLILCMLVPLIIRSVLPHLSAWATALFTREAKEKKKFNRHIEWTRNNYWWYDNDGQPSNSILQQAILNYINTKVDLLNQLPDVEYQLKKKPLEVKPLVTGDEEEVEELTLLTEHDYTFNTVPPIAAWVDLGNGIKFMRQQEELEDKNHKNQKV
ncbi:AAA domain-containing protein, partial [Haematococcus lacustris]